MFSKIFDGTSKGTHIYSKKTICDTHRQLYDVIITELAKDRQDILLKIIPLLEEAFLMGIKMNKRLVEHRLGEAHFGDNDVESQAPLRAERIRLVKLLAENNEILREFDENSNNLLPNG